MEVPKKKEPFFINKFKNERKYQEVKAMIQSSFIRSRHFDNSKTKE